MSTSDLSWKQFLNSLHQYLPPGVRPFSTFVHFVFNRFIDDNCLAQASALAYTTLLSLVPLLTLVFGMLSAFPAFQGMQEQIQKLLFENLVPTSGEQVQAYLISFTQKTSQLTAIGIAFLIITALLMVRTIDQALNHIWHTSRERSLVSSFMVYWSMLTVAPLLVGISVFITSYLLSLPLWNEMMQPGFMRIFLVFMPFMFSTIAFTLFYMLIPNRKVPLYYALLGGMVAAILFDVAKRGFALYVTHSDVYETIYGALATVPLFLLWIYVSWVVILLGAEITYCLSIFQWKNNEANRRDEESELIHAYRILGHLWQAQCAGRTVSIEDILRKEAWRDEVKLVDLLHMLRRKRWVYRSGETHHWGLARDLGEISFKEFYCLISNDFNALPHYQDRWNENLIPILCHLHETAEQIMNISLKELYKSHYHFDRLSASLSTSLYLPQQAPNFTSSPPSPPEALTVAELAAEEALAD